MLKFFLRIFILSIGIFLGIFFSSKITILDNTDTNSKLYKTESNINNVKSSNSKSINNGNLVIVDESYKDFAINLKYATSDNIAKTKLYPFSLCLLQKSTLDKLIAANEEFESMGYRIKIWDAYRPLSVQKKLWAVVPNSNYIANPFFHGSNHNRGTAVDITLVDLDGNEIAMPSGFDEFGPKSHRDYNNTEQIESNVKMLTDVMIRNGFKTINTEWWHFDDTDSGKYSAMDIDFNDLMKK